MRNLTITKQTAIVIVINKEKREKILSPYIVFRYNFGTMALCHFFIKNAITY